MRSKDAKARAELKAKLLEYNSGHFWHPITANVETLVTPETAFQAYDHQAVIQMWKDQDDEAFPEYDQFIEAIKMAAERIGYPVFIRSDLASAKHMGPVGYKAEEPEDIPSVLGYTIEKNETKLWLSPETPEHIMVREWVDIDAAFEAFGHGPDDRGLPIGKEWRLFASSEQVHCRHRYWPKEAIRFGHGIEAPEDWEQQYEDLWDLHGDAATVHAMAMKAARAVNREVSEVEDLIWSIDIAQDTSGVFWLIDMAIGPSSWHPVDCEHHGTVTRWPEPSDDG